MLSLGTYFKGIYSIDFDILTLPIEFLYLLKTYESFKYKIKIFPKIASI